MLLGTKVLTELLLFCLVLSSISEVVSRTDNDRSQSNRPLSPKDLQSYLTKLMSHNVSARSCPAPKLPITERDCLLQRCETDKHCPSVNQSCCFNGCLFTCLQKVPPPPIIDWEEEPLPALLSEGTAVRRCTTSPRPAPSEPVGCPAGYVCRIQDPGNPLDGRASSGICVPQAGTEGQPEDETGIFREKTGKETVYLPGGCVLSEQQYKDMQDFMLRSYVVDCFCIEGSVECQVSLQ